MIGYRNVRRPRSEEDRRYLMQLAGMMLARALEARWWDRPAMFIGAVNYARRSNERIQP